MTDFPGIAHRPATTILSTGGSTSLLGDAAVCLATVAAAGAWAAANRAIFVPVILEYPATAYQMAFIVGAQAGNYDVGIYNEKGDRLVSTGSTAVPVAGIALANIADTALTPGVYFLAMNLDTITTLTINRYNIGITTLKMCGVLTQDVGAVTLPNPATMVTANTSVAPALSVCLVPTM